LRQDSRLPADHEGNPPIENQLDRLSCLNLDDRQGIRTLSAAICRTIEGTAVLDDLAAAITHALVRFGKQAA